VRHTSWGRGIALLLTIVLAGGRLDAAVAHLAGGEAVDAKLEAAARLRAERVSSVQAVLRSDEAQKEAQRRGLRTETLAARVATLSDAELADLAQRSARVKDVVAGHSTDDSALVIVGVVLLVAGLVVLAAVGDWDDYYEDDCYCY
jgi:hypothetical protein